MTEEGAHHYVLVHCFCEPDDTMLGGVSNIQYVLIYYKCGEKNMWNTPQNKTS